MPFPPAGILPAYHDDKSSTYISTHCSLSLLQTVINPKRKNSCMEKDVVRKSLKRYSVRMKNEKSHERHHTIAALHPAGQRLSPIYGIYSYVTDILIASTAVMVIPMAKIVISN